MKAPEKADLVRGQTESALPDAPVRSLRPAGSGVWEPGVRSTRGGGDRLEGEAELKGKQYLPHWPAV